MKNNKKKIIIFIIESELDYVKTATKTKSVGKSLLNYQTICIVKVRQESRFRSGLPFSKLSHNYLVLIDRDTSHVFDLYLSS